jgi:hypothetical protein
MLGKSPQQDRSHKRWREANGGAQCGKSACCVRRGGDWKRGTVERPAGTRVLDPTCERLGVKFPGLLGKSQRKVRFWRRKVVVRQRGRSQLCAIIEAPLKSPVDRKVGSFILRARLMLLAGSIGRRGLGARRRPRPRAPRERLFCRRMITRHHRCYRSAICKNGDLIGDLIEI